MDRRKVIIAVAVAVAVVGWLVWRQWFQTYHLATVRQGVLYRDGVRDGREFATAIRLVHPRTVVSLVDDDELRKEPFLTEARICRDDGIDLVKLPVTLGGWPSSEQVKEFLAIASDPRRQPVLVHCAQGVRRTGMMVAAYQESVLDFSRDQAKNAILSFGHGQRTIEDVKKFIDIYDPATRDVTEILPVSSE
ncbi:MAG TPA: tyrosine-protein phosphatase [Tepidisphaeraceae bacterium]|nr:tyrosine-protein phosphatase [Tepidisphaeraceae bacterium]